MSADDKAMIKAARAKWKPFADVVEFAFDDESEIYTAGFIDGVQWARSVAAVSSGEPQSTEEENR